MLGVPAPLTMKSLPIIAAFASIAFLLPAFAEQPLDATTFARQIVSNHGGADKLLRIVKFSETYHLGGDLTKKGTDRTSIIQPPNLWYVGKTERVSKSGKGSVCQDIWMWTLAPLTDPNTKLQIVPDIAVEGKPAHGLKVSGTIEPSITAFFDASTQDLVRIDWRGQTFTFSDPVEVDGTRVPSRCVLLGKDGKERMRTELRSIERLQNLPADLPKPEE